MINHAQKNLVVSAVALLSLIFGWGISRAEEASVAGIYLLVEVNGEQLPANLWTEKPSGERCRQIILKGVLLLDSEGRSAALITDQEFCPNETDSVEGGHEKSVMFAGTYTISGNQITIEDDFGTDQAVIEGDVLVYKTGGNERLIEEFIFRKE